MSSFYEMGLAVGDKTTVPKIKVGEESKGGISETTKIGVMVGIIAVVGFFLLRKKPPQQGPDTSDIEDDIRRRGLDPYKYGYGSYRRA